MTEVGKSPTLSPRMVALILILVAVLLVILIKLDG